MTLTYVTAVRFVLPLPHIIGVHDSVQISRNQANNSFAKHRLYKQNKNVYRNGTERKRMVNWTAVYFAGIRSLTFHLTKGGKEERRKKKKRTI